MIPPNQIAADMKRALDTIFYPLDINCFHLDENKIYYAPPFYLDDKCNEMFFGVEIIGEAKSYPLTCTSEICEWDQKTKKYIPFVIESHDDWINKASHFVAWHDECVKLIAKIRSVQ